MRVEVQTVSKCTQNTHDINQVSDIYLVRGSTCAVLDSVIFKNILSKPSLNNTAAYFLAAAQMCDVLRKGFPAKVLSLYRTAQITNFLLTCLILKHTKSDYLKSNRFIDSTSPATASSTLSKLS